MAVGPYEPGPVQAIFAGEELLRLLNTSFTVG